MVFLAQSRSDKQHKESLQDPILLLNGLISNPLTVTDMNIQPINRSPFPNKFKVNSIKEILLKINNKCININILFYD